MEKEPNRFRHSPPILDNNTTTARKVDLKYKPWWQLTEEEKKQKKFNRAYQRFMLGVGMPGEYRLLTLTTPPDFNGDIHDDWRKFLMRMRRRGLIREYYAVKDKKVPFYIAHKKVFFRDASF